MLDKEKYTSGMNKLHSSITAEDITNKQLQKHSKGFKPAVLSLAIPLVIIIGSLTINGVTNGALFRSFSVLFTGESNETTSDITTDTSYMVTQENTTVSGNMTATEKNQSVIAFEDTHVENDNETIYLYIGEEQFDITNDLNQNQKAEVVAYDEILGKEVTYEVIPVNDTYQITIYQDGEAIYTINQ